MGEHSSSELPDGQHSFWAAAPLPSREEPVRELATQLSRTLALARALVSSGRTLDIRGIQDGIGLLCAQTLDLPVEQARPLLPELQDVLVQLDRLAGVVSGVAGTAAPSC